jgi:hypothetical protein
VVAEKPDNFQVIHLNDVTGPFQILPCLLDDALSQLEDLYWIKDFDYTSQDLSQQVYSMEDRYYEIVQATRQYNFELPKQPIMKHDCLSK